MTSRRGRARVASSAKLNARRVIPGCVGLEVGAGGQPRLRVGLVDEHVAAIAGIDRGLGRARVTRDDDAAVRRVETVPVALDGVLRREGGYGNVRILVNDTAADL